MSADKDKCCINIVKEDLDSFELSRFLKVLSDLNRLRIINLLKKGELCVCKIYKALTLPQNLVSHHLSKLKAIDIITERRDGNFIYYKLNKGNISEYNKLYKKLIGDQK